MSMFLLLWLSAQKLHPEPA